jgi:hypothetical protein
VRAEREESAQIEHGRPQQPIRNRNSQSQKATSKTKPAASEHAPSLGPRRLFHQSNFFVREAVELVDKLIDLTIRRLNLAT